ncbi:MULTISPECIES: PAC2 family protein [Pseudofrankia]|uniref:PAC2 family protein n=1 Tax=Pseudofrankia TaxID=2994363 RepID=UPI000234C02B|nr:MULTISPECIES: PAC2 family protein [Pseudofrankia]OHV32427.1 proteasome protein [Pseudofrankia sp. EUN1h]
MLDPSELYEIHGELPDLGRPVMLEAMTGVVDSGNAIRLASEHLLTTLQHEVVATFDIDLLLDYRSRRPAMTFVEDHWEHYEDPTLALYVLRDRADTPFLLLAGPEPDLMWKRFSTAVRELTRRMNLHLSVGLNAIPMAVPHTRPTGLIAHATRKDLIAGYEPWVRQVQVPGSAGHLLEYEFGREGRDAMGLAALVPHYLNQTDFPQATEVLLTSVSKATGLMLPLDGLQSAAEAVRGEVDQELAKGGEMASLVSALEEQYDAYKRGKDTGSLPTVSSEDLPTADELGAELERFLAEQSETDGPTAP